jgi:DNA-binding response OmpR family regulator
MTRILIVEDDQKMRELIEDYLSRTLNCEIEKAKQGQEALDKIRGSDFDLILLDINLPGLSGTDILKKAKEEKRNLDFLVVSGWDSLSVVEKSLEQGAVDYIPKPFSVHVLGLKVKEILSKKDKYSPKE